MHWADRMRVVFHPIDSDATILLGTSLGGLGGEAGPDQFPASWHNAYPSGVMLF